MRQVSLPISTGEIQWCLLVLIPILETCTRSKARAKPGSGGTHLVLRRTMSGSLNPMLADEDAGVVSIVVVVGDKIFVRCGEVAAAALSMLSAQLCHVSRQSLHSFNFPCIRVGTGHTLVLLRLHLAVPFSGVCGA